jgi:hypothetical protein
VDELSVLDCEKRRDNPIKGAVNQVGDFSESGMRCERSIERIVRDIPGDQYPFELVMSSA